MKAYIFSIALFVTLCSCTDATSNSETTQADTSKKTIPSQYLGEWRIISYRSKSYENTEKEISEIASEAQIIDYLPLYNANTEHSSAFFTLLFTTNDSLVVFATHCSGENTGNPKYVYPFTWKDGTLVGDSLTSEFEFGNDTIKINATYESTMAIENGNLIIEQSQIYLIPSKNLRQVKYQKTEYERYSQQIWGIESEGTCSLFPQQTMPLPVF